MLFIDHPLPVKKTLPPDILSIHLLLNLSFFAFNIIYFVCLCLGVEKRILKEIKHNYHYNKR